MKSNRKTEESGGDAFLVGMGLGILAMAALGLVKLAKMALAPTPKAYRENLEAEIFVLGHAGAGA